MGTLEKPDGTITQPGSDTLEYLLTQHFPSATAVKPTNYSNNKITRTEILNYKPDWITTERVKKALLGFQSKKSPGTDGLKPIIFKHLPDDIIQFITSLYKALVLLEFTPTKWKECKMVFIPKPGKPSYKVAKSWRPISLTNYLLKGLERLCAWQVDGEALQNPVHTLQHGFRTDRNTDTCLLYTSPSPRDLSTSRMPSSA